MARSRSRSRSRSRDRSRSRSRDRSRSRSRSPRRKEKKKKKGKRKDKHAEDERSSKKSRGEEGGSESLSMSIEETNRIRISLGLEPLATPGGSDSKQQEKEDLKKKEEDARKQREDDDIRQDLLRRRRQRALKAKTEGLSLGEELADVTGGSAADWVMRSRKIGKKKAAAGLRAALLAEQEAEAQAEYTSSDLKGLKVRHNMENFQDGSTVILTLKDSTILKDNGEVAENREEDMLENVNMVDMEKLEKNLKTKSQKKIYDATEDESADTLLPQYNEDKDEPEGMRLGDEEDEEAKRVAAIRAKLKKGEGKDAFKQGKTEYNLDFTTGVATDYLPAKPATFKKRRKKKDGSKKKKEKFVLAELSEEDRAKDHGSRSAGIKSQLDAKEEAAARATRDKGYLIALQKAEEDSKRMLEEVDQVLEDEDDAELQNSLDRARRLAKSKKASKGVKKEDDDYVDPIKRLAEKLKKMKEEKEAEDGDDDESMGVSVPVSGKGGQVFTATTEFCRGLQDTVDEEKVKAEEKERTNLEEEEEESGKKKQQKQQKQQKDFDPESMQNEDTSGDEDDSENEEDDFINSEPVVNAGASSALELMRARGLLKQKVEQVGRANDGLLEDLDVGSNISIVHLDEHGRPMKPKEAFRALSHRFHGRGPGAAKLEKNLKKIKEEARRKANLSRNKSLTMSKLKNHQNQHKQAFVVLEGQGATNAEPVRKRKEKKSGGSFKASTTRELPMGEARSKLEFDMSGGSKKRNRD